MLGLLGLAIVIAMGIKGVASEPPATAGIELVPFNPFVRPQGTAMRTMKKMQRCGIPNCRSRHFPGFRVAASNVSRNDME